MAILSCKRKNDLFYVAFGADTSIRFASRIKSALSKIMSEPAQSYYFDLSDIYETDITFIQLLIAFNEKLKRQSRKMFLLNPRDDSQFMYTANECGVDIRGLFEIEDGRLWE